MNSNEARREFWEGFILLLAKIFLCPITNKFISPERHLPLVLDVVNTRRYNWPLQLFTWIKDSIRDFQRKGVKHLSSCMFVLVVILFHRLEYGPLNRYRGPESWFAQWTLAMLDLRATSTLKKIRKNNDDNPDKKKKGKKGTEKKKRSKKIEKEDVRSPKRRKTLVKRKKVDEGEKEEMEEIEKER
ncbi:hypothetical protein PIB30_072622 [Stylosanthes scabra]|uniref:Uncharacterized protein n=1 Tax=Stylosanthes scabra TaxID=79078 RepID=A0ABU6ZMV5_9FABA|nr:hypothetical protein [Stylosanthes scabra]